MPECGTEELTLDAILADQLVRLAMKRDGISDDEMRAVILRARSFVLARQAEAA